MSETEQNKTEEPTPFKLRKAREKGQIARGMDLPFVGSLIGLALFIIILGPGFMRDLTSMMSMSFSASISDAGGDGAAELAIARIYEASFMLVLTFAACTVTWVLLAQVLQNKGLFFTTHPLKPDFSKLNPAKGLKRIFSLRTLKEAGKNILKMAIYLGGTYLVVRHCIGVFGTNLADGEKLIQAMYGSGLRLMFMFMLLGLFFAALDQIIVRKEFLKQMRMSKSELKREVKDREGEPRIKQKRKELRKEFAKQTGSLGDLPGSDMLIVNPQHFAVALRYDAKIMTAPIVTAKGRNRFALLLKSKASRLGISIIPNPPLARALYRQASPGQEIPSKHFKSVADSYLFIMRAKAAESATSKPMDEHAVPDGMNVSAPSTTPS